jgi:hypothetical protein
MKITLRFKDKSIEIKYYIIHLIPIVLYWPSLIFIICYTTINLLIAIIVKLLINIFKSSFKFLL